MKQITFACATICHCAQFVGLVTALVAPFAPTAEARGLSIARSAGMAGAYMGLARGVDAAYFNPANLGLASHRNAGFLIAGAGANISNNAFSLNDYNTYTGATLTETDKNFILNKIPVDGFVLSADAEASAAGFSIGSYALTFSGYGASEINLNKDIIDLLLNGNTFGDTISLTNMYGSGLAYGSANFSYGRPVYTMGNRQLSIGATGRMLKGLYHADITRMEGSAATLTTGYEGEGAIILQTADGGSGYAVDLGAALKLNKDYLVGLNIHNAMSRLRWDKNPEERGLQFSFDSLYVGNNNDSLNVTTDYTIPIAPYNSSLPRVMRLGLANTTGNFVWALDWEQGFEFAPGSSTKPRVALGAEYSILGFLPLRAGYAIGGQHGKQASVGAGLDLPILFIDVAALTTGGSTAYQSEGVQMAFSAGLNF